ncbi:mitochondrial transcription rescue factor 1 [Anser cygnoides]|uniref:Mitochondrial transcription rescue factor 1 n=1 Tax=Anser cygnoides TaxID=8845 RepID=A0A8B9DBR3_ANSCY|nr:mitochondrial transcription rescue factor 1 [Anser cygnoides]XP_013031106.1 mitochondrial transcription rescue factor 1 [Anser cygnoides]XP_047935158.1 mitochondrial transcription rescue factor 1 [Anser cygnoides]XP_047935159.1 mitochondrial transcription rescue factor 1 [Anser cygnoides]
MTGFRLPITAFRKLNVWFGLWEKFPSNKLFPSWRKSIFCSCQASTVDYRRYFSFSPVKRCALRLSPEYISVLSLRNKSSKSSKRNRQTVQEEEEEEEDEEESDLEDTFENDPNIVKDYKDLEKVVQSLRYDVIMKAGLDVARNKVEDAFYNNELRLNGEKLWKKSRTVKIGDTLDLLVGEDKETGTAVVMRVVLKKVSNKTESEKYKVILRRWKNLKVPKQDVLK